MAIAINGSGTITGISAGGLPDACITAAELDGAQSGSAPIYAARAWVNFNGTGVVAIRASGNVSSITDNGTGDYTVNFTTAMVDANYVVTATAGGVSNGAFNRTVEDVTARTSSLFRLYTNADAPQVNVATFR
jgi:hypothetical protein